MIAAALLAALGACRAPQRPVGPTDVMLDLADYESFVDESLTYLRSRDFAIDRVDREGGLIVTRPVTSAQWFEIWRDDAPGAYQTLESSLHTVARVVTVAIEPAEAADGAHSEPGRSHEVAGGDQSPDHEDQVGQDHREASAPDDGFGTPAVRPDSLLTDFPQPGGARSGPGRYRVQVRVDKWRYSAPERQVTTASGALAIYSERVPTTEGLRNARSRQAHWINLGRDGSYEARVLARLAERADRVRSYVPPAESPTPLTPATLPGGADPR